MAPTTATTSAFLLSVHRSISTPNLTKITIPPNHSSGAVTLVTKVGPGILPKPRSNRAHFAQKVPKFSSLADQSDLSDQFGNSHSRTRYAPLSSRMWDVGFRPSKARISSKTKPLARDAFASALSIQSKKILEQNTGNIVSACPQLPSKEVATTLQQLNHP
jgi:hypothetical protein